MAPRKKDNDYRSGEQINGEFVKSYEYLDKDGNPYARVDRYRLDNGGKKFPMFYFAGKDRNMKSIWKKGIHPDGKSLYNLPDLIKYPNKPVAITEGEEDADRLQGLLAVRVGTGKKRHTVEPEFLVTTISEGAHPGGWKDHRDKLDPLFKDRDVYIFEDNDKPGYGCAIERAECISDVASSIRIVKFRNDVPPGEDVSWWIDNRDGTRDKLISKMKQSPLYEPWPKIRVDMNNPDAMIKQITNALVLAEARNNGSCPVLVRGTQLVQPLYVDIDAAKRDGKKRKTRVTMLRSLNENNLWIMTTKWACTFWKWEFNKKTKKGKWLQCKPPASIFRAMIDEKHWGFPKVKGCIDCPTMRPDGTILDEAGLDTSRDTDGNEERTGLFYYKNPRLVMPPIPEKPTRKDAEKALATLNELISEVPFADERLHNTKDRGVDRAVALAAMLTVILRGAFHHALMFLFTASDPGSGKSYLVDLISEIAQGQACPVVDISCEKEERRKRIDSVIYEGMPLVNFDNIESNLNEPILNQMLSQEFQKVRILGVSELIPCEWRGTVFATGNNVQAVGDLIRRSLTCNINPGIENPERRSFKLDPIAMVANDRGKYLAAGFIIARAYLLAKDKPKYTPLGGFEGWDKFVRQPLQWLGIRDPLLSQDAAKSGDPIREDRSVFLYEWFRQFGLHLNGSKRKDIANPTTDIAIDHMDTGLRANDIIHWVEQLGEMNRGQDLPPLAGLIRTKAGGSKGLDARRFGFYLRALKGKTIKIPLPALQRGKNGSETPPTALVQLCVPTESAAWGNKWRLELIE